jgi:hypothetical protein
MSTATPRPTPAGLPGLLPVHSHHVWPRAGLHRGVPDVVCLGGRPPEDGAGAGQGRTRRLASGSRGQAFRPFVSRAPPTLTPPPRCHPRQRREPNTAAAGKPATRVPTTEPLRRPASRRPPAPHQVLQHSIHRAHLQMEPRKQLTAAFADLVAVRPDVAQHISWRSWELCERGEGRRGSVRSCAALRGPVARSRAGPHAVSGSTQHNTAANQLACRPNQTNQP